MCACSVVYVFALSAELGVLRKEVRFGLAGVHSIIMTTVKGRPITMESELKPPDKRQATVTVHSVKAQKTRCTTCASLPLAAIRSTTRPGIHCRSKSRNT